MTDFIALLLAGSYCGSGESYTLPFQNGVRDIPLTWSLAIKPAKSVKLTHFSENNRERKRTGVCQNVF